MEDKEEKEIVSEELNETVDFIKGDIKEFAGVMFYVGHSGEVIMLTTGKVSKKQQKTAERMLVAADGHSIILRMVISLEILFEKILYRIKNWSR